MRLSEHVLHTEQVIPRSKSEVFAFFSQAENLEQITPPALKFQIISPLPIQMQQGTLIEYRLRLLNIPFRWKTVITRWVPDDCFVDEQLQGPYRKWVHTHTFQVTETGTRVTDTVRYNLPMFPFGEIAYPLVKIQLDYIFRYRADQLHEILC